MMKPFICLVLMCHCALGYAQTADAQPQSTRSAFPSVEERDEIRDSLKLRRDALEDQYKQDMRICYQRFNVTSCRLEARDRRIEASEALRKEENTFHALERQIKAQEARDSLAERNSDAERDKAEKDRAAAVAAARDRASANEQKNLDQALKGTKRGEYDQKLRDAAEHKANLEKRLRERTKTPAEPLPVPNQ